MSLNRQFPSQTEATLNTLIELSPVSMCISSADSLILNVNSSCLQMFGYGGADEMCGRSLLSIVAPECRKEMENRARGRVRDIEQDNTFDAIGLRKDGSNFPILILAKRQETQDGYLTVLSLIDLSVQKQVEDGLYRQKQFSDEIINGLPSIFYMLDQQGRFIRVNLRFLEVSGYSQEALAQMSALDFFEGDDRQLIAQKLQEVFASGESLADAVFITKSGNKIPYHFTGHRTNIDDCTYLVGIGTDISEHKQAEIALFESEEKYRGLFENAGDLAYGTDLHGNFTAVSESLLEVSGYSRDELINAPISMILSPEHFELARQMTAAKLATKKQVTRYELEITNKAGKQIPLELVTTLTYRHGVPIGVQGIGRDISERKRIEADLHLASVAFDTQEPMLITDAEGIIQRVNKAFTTSTGYAADECIGNTPRLFKSDRHGEAFYRNMWEEVALTGTWQGEIWDRRKNGQVYPKWLTISAVVGRDGVVTNYVGSHIDITDRKVAEEKNRLLAYQDPLTHLPNRLALNERLAQAIGLVKRNKKQMALMLIDLDSFKNINDTLGHMLGDQLLVQVAERLSASVRETDFVARLGGDEFVIMLPEIDSPSDAAHVANKILHSVSEPYFINALELNTSPSIGICLYPDDATDDQDLIKKADVAMYYVKSQGRRNYHFFNQEMQHATLSKIDIENDLRAALKHQQFILHYQPQLELRTGMLMGVEALVRWQHPTRGIVSPIEFIPIAEETGLIRPLGDWVLQEACRQLAEWRAGGIKHIKMSVNLAASQFDDQNFPARIQEIMAQNNLPSDSLDFEVTESMIMRSPTEAVDIMNLMTGQGLSMSIDDFGTGYSSLSYLKTFPISTLKIDRSFVTDIETDLNDASICDITVLLAHKLGMQVIAEGVETEAQLKYLLSIGCERIQGFLISRPLPADQAEHFIRTTPRISNLGTIDLWMDS